MAKFNETRNIVLSLINYIEPLLEDEGYNFTFVSNWGADKDIVLPKDYVAGTNQIKMPAGKFTLTSRPPGTSLGIGDTGKEFTFFFNLFIHAESEGQNLDLLDFFYNRLSYGQDGRSGHNRITIYDFGMTGYPSIYAPALYGMTIEDVRHRPILNLAADNVALMFAGSITFVGKIVTTIP